MVSDDTSPSSSDEALVFGEELQSATPAQRFALWEQHVLERRKGLCDGCGSSARVKAKPIVPLEVGGALSLENACTICRACEMATAALQQNSKGRSNRPLNFWVSRELHDRMKSFATFASVGSLIRFLIERYSSNPDNFNDLDLWQDAGASDLKVNVWIDHTVYETFKSQVNTRGLTVTSAIKSLVRLYGGESDPRLTKGVSDG